MTPTDEFRFELSDHPYAAMPDEDTGHIIDVDIAVQHYAADPARFGDNPVEWAVLNDGPWWVQRSITLYDDEAERIYLHRDGDPVAWDITQLVIYHHPDLDGDGFVALARDWHDADPSPDEIPSDWGLGNPIPLSEAQVHPYEAVARWTPDGGLSILHTRVRRDVRRFLGTDVPSTFADGDA